MRPFQVIFLLVMLFVSLSSLSSLPKIIDVRPSFHHIDFEIENPLESPTNQELAVCENHPWSLNRCQTKPLKRGNQTMTINSKLGHG